MGRKFTRNVEDFTCEKCGKFVRGDGYTNHCPHCFFSKHVDIFPGDRQAKCGGLMEPVGVESSSKGYVIAFRCMKCGIKKKNKFSKQDDHDALINLARSFAKRGTK